MTDLVIEPKLVNSDHENNEMGSQNHSIVQARLAGLLLPDERYTVATELSLDVQNMNISDLFKEAKNELKPDICLYPTDSDFDFIDTGVEDDILRRTEMPVLAVEILSPTDKIAVIVAKIRAYLKIGVKSCWLVAPDLKTITVYSGSSDTNTFGMQSVEVVDNNLDIRLPMQKIFATRKKQHRQ
jgi:Uma2 family endonuclease